MLDLDLPDHFPGLMATPPAEGGSVWGDHSEQGARGAREASKLTESMDYKFSHVLTWILVRATVEVRRSRALHQG